LIVNSVPIYRKAGLLRTGIEHAVALNTPYQRKL
jgi:hypothetical protein